MNARAPAYRVDLVMRPETLARLDALAVSLDLSIQGFVVLAVAEYLRARGFEVDPPPVRRRYRDQSGFTPCTQAYRKNDKQRAVKVAQKRPIAFPEAWRGHFSGLYLTEQIDARLLVRAATVARMERLKDSVNV